MASCYTSRNFKKYFAENMHDLGLKTPSDYFDTVASAISTGQLVAKTPDTLGKGATLEELAGATTGLEKLMVGGSILASYYGGAVIGSVAVATGRFSGCGTRLSDFFIFLHNNNLWFKNANLFYMMHREILDPDNKHRQKYGIMGRVE